MAVFNFIILRLLPQIVLNNEKKRNKHYKSCKNIEAAFVILSVNFKVFPVAEKDDHDKDYKKQYTKNDLSCSEHFSNFTRS